MKMNKNIAASVMAAAVLLSATAVAVPNGVGTGVVAFATDNEEEYTITASANPAAGGTVTVNPEKAKAGEEVDVKAVANEGYTLKSVKVMSGETEVTYANQKFTMPAGNVTVTVTFEEDSTSSESSSSSSSSSESSSSSSSSSESSSSSSSSSESSSSSSSSSESSSSSSSSSSTSSDTPSESTSTPVTPTPTTPTPSTSTPSSSTPSTSGSSTTAAPAVEFKPAEVVVDEAFSEEAAKVVEEIKIEAPEGTFAEGTKLSVKPDTKVTAENAFALDISFELDGAAVQPKDGAAVTVSVPVPPMFKDVDQSTLKVFYFDGTNYIKLDASVTNGVVTFKTTHFSTYVISTENLAEKNTPAATDKNPITGVAAMAALPVVVLAGAVIVVAKKRK